MQEENKGNKTEDQENRLKLWLKRLGVAGFLFFLIKGLVWLALFLGVAKYFS